MTYHKANKRNAAFCWGYSEIVALGVMVVGAIVASEEILVSVATLKSEEILESEEILVSEAIPVFEQMVVFEEFEEIVLTEPLLSREDFSLFPVKRYASQGKPE